MSAPLSRDDIVRVFQEEYGRAVAVLVRAFGNIDLAEECVQDAFATAIERWLTDGLPPSPAGWIITAARNRAIDRLRREFSREERHAQAMLLHEPEEMEEDAVPDERLRLIFTCCHPALAPHAQVALTLRLIGGLTTTEIARAFLIPEVTMGSGCDMDIRDEWHMSACTCESNLRARFPVRSRTGTRRCALL